MELDTLSHPRCHARRLIGKAGTVVNSVFGCTAFKRRILLRLVNNDMRDIR
jgi:hypothetical protein